MATTDAVSLKSMRAGNWLTMYVPTGTANSYAGTLHVKTGNLQIGSYNGAAVSVANQNKAIPDTASVTIETGSTLRFVWTGGAETIDGLNGGGTIDRNTGDGQGVVALTLGASNGSGLFFQPFGRLERLPHPCPTGICVFGSSCLAEISVH